MQQEDAMRSFLHTGVAVTALLAGLGVALAQQPENKSMQSPQAEKAQNESTRSESGKAGTTEPGSHMPSDQPADSAVFVHGALAAPGASPDGETVPAKWSERNAALDKVPTMAMPLPLSDEQKRRIYNTVSAANKPVAHVAAHPTHFLPASVELFELPAEVANIPGVRDLKYVRLDDRVLLVQPANKVVVGEVNR
jgi:hypothetical protein